MNERPDPPQGWAGNVPAAVKILGFASLALSVTLVLLVHHFLTTWKCPIPSP